MAPITTTRAIDPPQLEYSFALEYVGPPLAIDLPEALPIDLDHIPLASLAPSPPSLVPIAVPLPNPKSSSAVSPTSVVDGPVELAPAPRSGDLSADFSSDFKESARADHASTASSEFGFRSDDDPPPPVPRRVSAVRFGDDRDRDPSPRGLTPNSSRERPRKGACYRCLRGSRFTEKEACVVCDAKYCSGCVLRAMGSMPEGRKCVACIGFPVDESRRERLGKCSRLLRKLLSSAEIEHAMRAERCCEANQLRSECIRVNGRPLSPDEMDALRTCAIPPSKLKPGSYWYDRVSGFWGKEGFKPHLIISPNLHIGGPILDNASNGNTGVFINGRNITKSELRMLKLTGVQCDGSPQFWLHSDGAIQEEGMNNVKGNLWGTPTSKLLCSLLSLPHPSKKAKLFGEVDDGHNRNPDYNETRSLQKLLLVGYYGSGTSTILKQARFLYNRPFSKEEREIIKLQIQTNIYHYLCILLEGRERFEEDCLSDRTETSPEKDASLENEGSICDEKTIYSISPPFKKFSDWLLKILASGDLEVIFPAASREYADLVEKLWKDPAIQATYDRRKELQSLPVSANYFLDQVADISRLDYEPSDRDILHADGITSSNGIAHTEFLFPSTVQDRSDFDDASQHETVFRYQLIRVQSRSLSENKRWLDMFEDVRLVIFCVALSDYSEYYEDPSGETMNKMLCSKMLFENMITHPTFAEMDFLLVLTKFDLLEKKITEEPLKTCDWFGDFNPVVSHHPPGKNSSNSSRSGPNRSATPAEQAFHYIAVKFKRLYESITSRKLYVTMANGLESESVDRALRYAREVLKWEDERAVFGTCSEFTVDSTDPGSTSV